MRKPRLVLNAEQNAALNEDIATHDRMRQQMAPHTKDVLALELGLSPAAIQHMESAGFVRSSRCRIPAKVYNQVRQSRAIYWQVRNQYVPRYSFKALMQRYNISRSVLKQRINDYRDRPYQEWRAAA